MRARSAALLMVAIACGLVASVGVTQALSNRAVAPSPVAIDGQSVFVAIKDIPLGETVTPDMLRVEQWPKDKVPEGAISHIEQFEGRRTKTKLYAGEILLERKLFQKGAGGAADDFIPKGYRAVAVKVDAVSGFHDMLSPGSRVDVMVYLRYAPEQGIHETTTRCILQDIKVFAVNDTLLPDSKDQSRTSASRERTVSLLVTPEQAAALTLASEMGRIRLVLRSPEDDQEAPISEVTSTGLFGRSNPGRRKTEELIEPAAENPVADKLRAMLAGLSGTNSQTVEQHASNQNRWTVRVLRPGAIDDIELQAEPTTDALVHAGGIWKKVANGNSPLHGLAGTSRGGPKPAASLSSAPPADIDTNTDADQPTLEQPLEPSTTKD